MSALVTPISSPKLIWSSKKRHRVKRLLPIISSVLHIDSDFRNPGKNDAAGSSNTHGGKSVKGRQGVAFPRRAQVKANLPPQSPQHMSLVRPWQIWPPSGFVKPVGQGLADSSDRGLKATPVPFRPQADHSSAIRTPVSPNPQGNMESLEICRNKPVPPHPPLAAWAYFRP